VGYCKATLRGKIIVINAYIKKIERSQIENPTFCFKELEQEEQTQPNISRRKKNKSQRINKRKTRKIEKNQGNYEVV